MKTLFYAITFTLMLFSASSPIFACTCSIGSWGDVVKSAQERNRLFFVGEVLKIVDFKIHDQANDRDVVLSRHVT